VVAYDLTHQAMLAGRLVNTLHGWNRPSSSWSEAALPNLKFWGGWALALALIVALLILAGPRWLRRARGKAALRRFGRAGGSTADAALVYRKMLDALERRGFEKPPCITPDEFVRQLPAHEREAVAQFTVIYNSVRFGGRTEGNAELLKLLQQVER
jgi:hypothetical protein